MNKKLTNVLRTNVTLYFICLVLFALAAIPFDVRLAIGKGAAAVLPLIIARRRSRSVQQSMRQYMDRFTGGMDSARSSNMLFAPLPMMVFDADTQAVVWCNDGFLELTEQKEGVFDAHLNAVVPSFSVRWLLEGKNECPENVVWNHRIYRVYGGLTRPTPDTPSTMATTYWMDVTDSEQLRQTLQMTRPVVAILMVDNYEDLMKACPESKRSAVLAQLEEKLDQWSAGADGLMLHYDRDRYLFVFEERSYSDYAQHRFAVLDTVREVAAGGVAATLSIGVGRDADSFDALFKNASMALEMALSRGGDQAVVKDRLNFQFYGGRAKTTEKRTKVKSRVMANALGELMDDARQVYVMGHSYADMDSLGAAAGVCCIARKRGRKCQIVIDTENNAVHPMLRKLAGQPEYHGGLYHRQRGLSEGPARHPAGGGGHQPPRQRGVRAAAGDLQPGGGHRPPPPGQQLYRKNGSELSRALCLLRLGAGDGADAIPGGARGHPQVRGGGPAGRYRAGYQEFHQPHRRPHL